MVEKGFIRMFESILASMLLLSFLLLLIPTEVTVKKDISYRGYDILHSLDNEGIIRNNIKNVSEIEKRIKIAGYNHSVVICDIHGNCNGTAPEGNGVWVSSMIISNKDIYVVRLYLW